MLFTLAEFVFEAGVWVIRTTWTTGTWMIWGHQATIEEIAMGTCKRLEEWDIENRLEQIEKTQREILNLLQHGTTETESTTQSHEA